MRKVLLVGLLLVGCSYNIPPPKCPCVIIGISAPEQGGDNQKSVTIRDAEGYIHSYYFGSTEAKTLSTRQVRDTL